MTPKEVLIASKALIDTPEKWCKYHSSLSYRLCANTALNRVPIPGGAYKAGHIRGGARWFLADNCDGFIESFNDHPDTTHADIMALYDRAIEAAGES